MRRRSSPVSCEQISEDYHCLQTIFTFFASPPSRLDRSYIRNYETPIQYTPFGTLHANAYALLTTCLVDRARLVQPAIPQGHVEYNSLPTAPLLLHADW
jgi:hypothetical protein